MRFFTHWPLNFRPSPWPTGGWPSPKVGEIESAGADRCPLWIGLAKNRWPGCRWVSFHLPRPSGCRCQNRFGIPFWLVGEFTTHFRLPILVVGLGPVHWGLTDVDFDPWPTGSGRGSEGKPLGRPNSHSDNGSAQIGLLQRYCSLLCVRSPRKKLARRNQTTFEAGAKAATTSPCAIGGGGDSGFEQRSRSLVWLGFSTLQKVQLFLTSAEIVMYQKASRPLIKPKSNQTTK